MSDPEIIANKAQHPGSPKPETYFEDCILTTIRVQPSGHRNTKRIPVSSLSSGESPTPTVTPSHLSLATFTAKLEKIGFDPKTECIVFRNETTPTVVQGEDDFQAAVWEAYRWLGQTDIQFSIEKRPDDLRVQCSETLPTAQQTLGGKESALDDGEVQYLWTILGETEQTVPETRLPPGVERDEVPRVTHQPVQRASDRKDNVEKGGQHMSDSSPSSQSLEDDGAKPPTPEPIKSDQDSIDDRRFEEVARQASWLEIEKCAHFNPTTFEEFRRTFMLPSSVKPRDNWRPASWSESKTFRGCYIYQLFSAWWQLRSESAPSPEVNPEMMVERGTRLQMNGDEWTQGCGGFNCDEMGLGKMVEVFATIALNNLVLENRAHVQASRTAGTSSHLSEEQGKRPGAQCPSQVDCNFVCTCVRDSPTNNLIVRHGANVVVMPVGTFKAYEEFFTLTMAPASNDAHPWRMVRAHRTDVHPDAAPFKWTLQDARKYLYPSQTREQWEALSRDQQKEPQFQYASNTAMDYLIVVTTSHSLAARVIGSQGNEDFHVITRHADPGSIPCRRVKEGNCKGVTCSATNHTGFVKAQTTLGFKLCRVWRDEFHVEFNANTRFITSLDQLLQQQRLVYGWKSMFTVWLLSGTPFNASPSEMFAYINWMRKCVPGENVNGAWRRHPLLGKFSNEKLTLHNKAYKDHLEMLQKGMLKRWAGRTKKPTQGLAAERAQVQGAGAKANEFFIDLIPVFCIRRSDTSMFNGQPITLLPELVQTNRAAPMTATWRARLQQHFRSREQAEEPVDNRLKQVYLNYPALCELLPDCVHTAAEAAPYYRIPTQSPYAEHIHAIAQSSGKLQMLRTIMESELQTHTYRQTPLRRMERLVIGTVNPATAVIVYLFLTEVMKMSRDQVQIYHSKLDLEERGSLVDAFQDKPVNLGTADEDEFMYRDQTPTVLIVQTTVGNVGINLQSSSAMIKMEVDGNYARDAQMTKRIHRNGQIKKCRVFTLVETGLDGVDGIDLRLQTRSQARKQAAEGVLVSKHTARGGKSEDDPIVLDG